MMSSNSLYAITEFTTSDNQSMTEIPSPDRPTKHFEDVIVTAWLKPGEDPTIFAQLLLVELEPVPVDLESIFGLLHVADASHDPVGVKDRQYETWISVWDQENGWVMRNLKHKIFIPSDRHIFARSARLKDSDCLDLKKYIPGRQLSNPTATDHEVLESFNDGREIPTTPTSGTVYTTPHAPSFLNLSEIHDLQLQVDNPVSESYSDGTADLINQLESTRSSSSKSDSDKTMAYDDLADEESFRALQGRTEWINETRGSTPLTNAIMDELSSLSDRWATENWIHERLQAIILEDEDQVRTFLDNGVWIKSRIVKDALSFLEEQNWIVKKWYGLEIRYRCRSY